ncbi:MAG TPA: histidine phosphatase family protein [Pirellulaceae bacterium]|nr:histidine phosphatase family protein [Pirellulaceae bacterium]
MKEILPVVYLARHGETAWSLSGQHTGRTDIPLTAQGEENATALGQRLAGLSFARVYSSDLLRQRQTCQLAGFGEYAEIDMDLVEWDYGDYEGLTTAEIRRDFDPDWQLFRDGCPGGESLAQVAARADVVIHRWRQIDGNILAFSSGHFSRVLAARWCGVEVSFGQHLHLTTAALNVLGYEHSRVEPALRLWNDCRHVGVEDAR